MELSRVGIGKGGFWPSGKLGLLERVCWLAIEPCIMAAFLMSLDRLEPATDGGAADAFSYALLGFLVWLTVFSLPDMKGVYMSAPSGLTDPLVLRLLTNWSDDMVAVPKEPRLLDRFVVGKGRGADRAVLYSESLASGSWNSSASSELAESNPAKRLLLRCGRFIAEPSKADKGPLSLLMTKSSSASIGDEGTSSLFLLPASRRGFLGGKFPGSGVKFLLSSSLYLAGEVGRDEIAEGLKCSGSWARRLSTWMPSVCTAASLVGMPDEMFTWQPKFLK